MRNVIQFPQYRTVNILSVVAFFLSIIYIHFNINLCTFESFFIAVNPLTIPRHTSNNRLKKFIS